MALFSSKKNTEKKVEETAAAATTPAPKKAVKKSTGTKAKTSKAKAAPAATTESKEVAVVEHAANANSRSLAHIIRNPRITEKASMQTEAGIYCFDVATSADKRSIAAAVKLMYNVTPVKVAVVAIPARNVMIRNRPGVKKGGKKAYVYLKTGDKIEFV